MRRALITLGLVAAAAGWVAMWWQDVEAARRETDMLVNSRVAYWQARIENDLPVGTSSAVAARWLHDVAGLSGSSGLDPRWSTTVQIEMVQGVSPQVLCGDWHVDISVGLGPDGTVMTRGANAMLICF